jgi:hypothetical protein
MPESFKPSGSYGKLTGKRVNSRMDGTIRAKLVPTLEICHLNMGK